jgi:chaperonin GroES
MNLRPLNNNLIIAPIEIDNKTASGLVIPEAAADKPEHATVISVGEGSVGFDGTRIPIGVKANDKIMFNKHAGVEIKAGEQRLLLITANDIMAVIE